MLLALIPVAGALLNLANIRTVQSNLDHVAQTAIYFGEQHFNFRIGVRRLSLQYAEAENFESVEGLERTREVTERGLAIMRSSLEQLAAADAGRDTGDLLIAQREVEQSAATALHTAAERLASRGRLAGLDLNAAERATARQEQLALDGKLVEQHIGMRKKVQSMLEELAEIDRENFSQTSFWMQATSAALDKSVFRLLAIAAGSALIALLFIYLIIHRKLIRRLRGLTAHIAAQNAGDLATPVPVDGDDELTAMAEALESARQNAVALRASETALAERSVELERMIAELDNFAYVASHDLKAPMRAIYSISGFLEEDLGDQADATTRKHIAMLKDRSKRLSTLLDALLEYSRVGRERTLPESVDLHRMLSGCAELVAPQGGDIRLTGNSEKVSTWRTPLEQIVRNLIDNAYKHNEDGPGTVYVNCTVADQFLTISVRDEGPGIASVHHERIFKMFHRLKPENGGTDGSGMGLAVLKKLVDSHGGAIEIISDPASKRGATFVLSWPHDGIIGGNELAA